MNDNKKDVYDILNALEEEQKRKSEQRNTAERSVSERRVSANNSAVHRNAEEDNSKTKTMQRNAVEQAQQRTGSSQTRQTGTQPIKKRPQREYEVISENKSDAKKKLRRKNQIIVQDFLLFLLL